MAFPESRFQQLCRTMTEHPSGNVLNLNLNFCFEEVSEYQFEEHVVA